MEPFRFDPFDEATRRDPFALFARARREHPVWRHEGLPVVSVFRHADVQAILRDPARFSNVFPPPPGMTAEDVLPSMLGADPPHHTRLRGLVSQAFTPRMVQRLAPRVEAVAEELVAAAVAQGTVDLVEALTYPLPVVVIAELLGIPAEDRARFKTWSDDVVANLGAQFFAPPSPERLAAFRHTIAALRAYFTPLVAERRVRPADDLLSALVAAELDGSRLDFEELMGMLVLLLVAGNETTTTLIGNAVLTLLEYPAALARLRAEPALLGTAVDEVMRYTSPVQMDPRRATCAVELHGAHLEPGQFILCWLGAANRDEAVFPDAERFDPARTPNRHLGFGFGPHYCLGAPLAVLEAETALRVLLRRTRSFARPDDAPLPRHPSIVFRAVTRLPLGLTPA